MREPETSPGAASPADPPVGPGAPGVGRPRAAPPIAVGHPAGLAPGGAPAAGPNTPAPPLPFCPAAPPRGDARAEFASDEDLLPTGGPLKRIVRDLRPRARVLAVVSGKGGVGKTNLAVNVAIALAAAGQRVLLVDADFGLANVDLVLGKRPRGDLGHVLSGQIPLQAAVHDGPAGIHWIPGASHMPALARLGERYREALLDGLETLETRHDFVILDAPAGIGTGVLNVARQADELLLVTTPEPTALMDAYTTLKAVAAAGAESIGQVRLVVNMVSHRRDAERVHRRIREAAGRFLGVPVELAGYVFCDGHVGRAVQRQEPLLLAYPHSQAAWCIKRLAGEVLEGKNARTRPRFAFFRRLAKLFAAG